MKIIFAMLFIFISHHKWEFSAIDISAYSLNLTTRRKSLELGEVVPPLFSQVLRSLFFKMLCN